MKNLSKKILDLISDYKSLSVKMITKYFNDYPSEKVEKHLNYLLTNGLLSKHVYNDGSEQITFYQSPEYNPNHDISVFDNDYIAVEKCFATLIALRNTYNITFHKLCYYPSTIRFSVDAEDGEHFFEIVYVPYSDNNVMAKHIGFYFDREFDKRFDVKRFAVCESKWSINNCMEEIKSYIPNIVVFVWVASNGTPWFFSADETEEF